MTSEVDQTPAGRAPRRKSAHPAVAVLVLVCFLVAIVVALVITLTEQRGFAPVYNAVAATATLLGLIFLAVADFIPRWQKEDSAEGRGAESVERNERRRDNLSTLGHSIVLVGGAYFLATAIAAAFV